MALAVVAAVGALVLRAPWAQPAGPAAPVVPQLVDETASSGLLQRNDGPDLAQVGGGVAVFDCNGDGRPDIYVAGGSAPAALFRNDSEIGGAIRFTRLEVPAADLANVNGAYPIDVDGDGAIDLVVLRIGESEILRGDGDCGFTPANADLGLPPIGGYTTAFSATWEGDARLPTLAFGRYLKLDASGARTFDCDDNLLVRPAATGPGYGTASVLAPGDCALSMLFSDWDGSGRHDLRVSNDRQWYRDGMEQLWRMDPGLPPRLYTAADGWQPLKIWGMGIASRDVTGDGLPDVFLTSQGDNKLQTLADGPGQPTFSDIALRRGVTSAQPNSGGQHLPSTAWHPEFGDVNDDGSIDLFVTKGNVGAQDGYATMDPNDLFLGRTDGTFVQAAEAAGIVRYDRGRGAALVDLNLDGLLDLVVVNYGTDAVVWRNVGSGTAAAPRAMGHWAEVSVTQPGPNRDAIGGWLDLRIGETVTSEELTIGGGHIGGELGWRHLGLGDATAAEVRVRWPDGTAGSWMSLPVDAFSRLDRTDPVLLPWAPGA